MADASGPLSVLGAIRDVLVQILGATQQQEKHEDQAAHGADSSPHDNFRRELAESVKDAIQSGMHAFVGRGGGGGGQPAPMVPSVPQAGLRSAPQPSQPTVTAERPAPLPQQPTPIPQRPEVLPQPTLPAVPATQRPAPQPTPQPTPNSERQPFKPLDLGNPFKDRPPLKSMSDGVSTPAVVPVAGPAPTANLLPTSIPAEMRTGVNMPVTVPTTNTRPMGNLPTTLAGFHGTTGQHQGGLPTTPGLLGNMGGQRPGGGQVGGGSELLDASRRLSQSAGLMAEAARRNTNDTAELSDNYMPQMMQGLSGYTARRAEQDSAFDLLGKMPNGASIGGGQSGDKEEADVMKMITRLLGG